MSASEMLPILTEWRDTLRAAESDIERFIGPLKCSPESPLYAIPWNLMEAYTDAVSLAVGDRDEWLAWYASDNEWGAKKREAMVNGKYRKIKTLRDLARVKMRFLRGVWQKNAHKFMPPIYN